MKLLLPALLLSALILCAPTQAAEKQTLTVKLDAPDSAWTLAIDSVYQTSNTLYVVSNLARDPETMGAAVITPLQDSIEVTAPSLPQKHYILGKTWNWENSEPYLFIDSPTNLPTIIKSATVIYTKTTPSSPAPPPPSSKK